MKCAVYARVSTPGQKEVETIKSQLSTLPVYAKRQGWQVFDTYVDEGLSGSSIKGRPDFQRLLRDIEDKKFNIILITEHSRITRTEDIEERGRILGALQRNSIKLASPGEGLLDMEKFADELVTTVKMIFAGREKREMIERFKRGRRQKLRDGKFVLNQIEPYGLRKIVKRDEKGRPETQFLVINETEQNILRTIYDLIMEGNTLRQVCKYLNDRKMLPREAKEWKHYNLSRILDNTSLYGELLLFADEEEPILYEVPRIFTKQEWDEMRAMISMNRTTKGRYSDHFLFRGRLKCSLCGGPMMLLTLNGGRYKYYVCRYHKAPKSRLPKGKSKCMGAPMCPAHLLDKLVLRKLLVDLLVHPEKTIEAWTLNKGKMVELKALREKIAALNRQGKQLKSKKKKLLDLYINASDDDMEIYDEKKQELETATNVLRTTKADVEAQLRKVEETEANIKALESSRKELKKLPKRLYDKVMNMDAENLKRLIEHLIPAGTFIMVGPTEPYVLEPVKDKHTMFKKPVKITFKLSYVGLVNIKALVHVLKVFENTGKILSTQSTRHTYGWHSP